MQKLIQGDRILDDKDIVGTDDLLLVRMPRKRMLVASLHADLRSYDLETGSAMRVMPSSNLRLSCMLVDWETARCFTGSANGIVRVWDVFSNNILGTLPGLQGKVSAIASDENNRLLAASENGALRFWVLLEKGSGEVTATDTHEWEIEVSGPVALSVNWQHPLALVSGENKKWQALVVAYDLRTYQPLWSWRLPGPTPALVVDWPTQRCLVSPGRQCLELRGVEAATTMKPKQFAHERLDRKGLFNVDWANDLVIFAAKPFGLELWSLSTFQVLHRLSDGSAGNGVDIISMDVDWSQEGAPRAITCRTYIDWELVAGEVCIQHWDMQEGGEITNVPAEHPLIGGFDIVAAIAQF